MKIWIDFINSPQVSFFIPLIEEFSRGGHEFVLTCRDSANTVQLIQKRGWHCKIIGDKAEKGLGKKLVSFPQRVVALHNYLKDKQIDVAIGQSSFYLPITAKLLGVPSIYTNDNEHALGNIPSFLFATKILLPENMSLDKVIKKGARRGKILQYPGIKEGVYLWPIGNIIQQKRQEQPGVQRRIFVRPEPRNAQYYSGNTNFLDEVLVNIKEKYPVTVLVRDKTQLEHYTQPKFSGIDVPLHPLSFEEVASNCELFLGAGGSMTREMAILGICTISVYQGELLDVDKFLISKKLLRHSPAITVREIDEVMNANNSGVINDILIEKGKQAYELIKSTLVNIK